MHFGKISNLLAQNSFGRFAKFIWEFGREMGLNGRDACGRDELRSIFTPLTQFYKLFVLRGFGVLGFWGFGV